MKKGDKKSPLKDTYSRRPGQSLDERIARVEEKVLLFIVTLGLFAFATFTQWISYYYETTLHPLYFTLVFTLVLMFCIMQLFTLSRQRKNLVLGREGEREVAEYLDNLTRKGCYIFHDIPGPNFNIDHVIIATSGVFVVETKTYRKPLKGQTTITFGGQTVTLTGQAPDPKPIKQAIINAEWVSKKLRENITRKQFNITAILVYPGWFILKEQMKHDGIWVMNEKWLESSITELKPIYTPDEVQTIVNVVRPLVQVKRTK